MFRSHRSSLALLVFVVATTVRPAAVLAQTSTVAIIPQVAAGSFDGGVNVYSTAIQVINSETTSVTLDIRFFAQDGSASTSDFTTTNTSAPTFRGSLSPLVVPSNSSVIIRTAGATQGVVNWGRIQASNTVTIAAVFDVSDARGNVVSRVGVPASKPDGVRLVIPRIRDVSRAIETGFAVVNSGESNAEITARLYSAGQVVATRSLILGPKRQTAQYFSQLFSLSEAAGFTSWTHVDLSSSTQSLAAMALLLEDNRLTSLPVSFLPAASPTGGTTTVTPVIVFAAETVDFGRSGQKLGSFVRTAAGQWDETNSQGQTNFRYVETSRDANAVYMLDRARNVSIQINLSTGKIFFIAPGTQPVELYDILTSSNAPVISQPSTVSAPDADAFYFLQTKLSQLDRKCLEGNQLSPQNTLGGYSFMDDCSLVTGQLWKFLSLESRGYPGYYQITTYGQQNEGLCLESGEYNKSTNSGAGSHMGSCGSALFTGQIWKLLPAGDGFKLQSKSRESANQCLDGNKVAAGNTLNGAAFMNTCGDLVGQIWTKIPQSQFSSIPDPKVVTPPVDANSVNGFTVEQADYGAGGSPLGSFYRTGATEWKERDNKGQARFTFREVNRDEWSVYLRDDSRQITIQIDLYRKKVVYSDANTRFDLYDVQRWAAVTGYTAQHVYFGSNSQRVGGFFQTGAAAWKEVDAAGKTTFNFSEAGRDDWSIYLRDAGRNVNIQLDVFRKKILYSLGSASPRDIYDILSMTTSNGLTVQQTMYGQKANRFGTFVQTAPGQWKETNAQGTTTFTFIESRREDWSVFLRDASRGVSIEIDLSRKKIVYSDPRTQFDLYDVLQSSIIGSAALLPPIDRQRIGFVGSSKSYTQAEFSQLLSKQGYQLVGRSTTSLNHGQCAVIYQKSDKVDESVEGGVLMCNVVNDGDTRVDMRLLHGGCDRAGVTGACEATGSETKVTINTGKGVSTVFTVKALETSACGALSAERTCANAGVDLVSAGVKVESKNGSGIGFSAAAGVGGGLLFEKEDDTTTIGVCTKALIGACVELSLNENDVTEAFILGPGTWFEKDLKIVAIGDQGTKGLTRGAGAAVVAAGQVITAVETAGKKAVVVAENIGQRASVTYTQARQTVQAVATTTQATTGKVVTAAVSGTKRLVSIFF